MVILMAIRNRRIDDSSGGHVIPSGDAMRCIRATVGCFCCRHGSFGGFPRRLSGLASCLRGHADGGYTGDAGDAGDRRPESLLFEPWLLLGLPFVIVATGG